MLNSLNINDYKIKEYKRNEVILKEGDYIDFIGIVYSGEVSLYTYTITGFEYEIKVLKENDIFGDSLIIENKKNIPGYLKSKTDSKIIYIKKDNFLDLLNNNKHFLKEYLIYVSKRNSEEIRRIKLLAQPSIREKILFYLKDEMIKQNNKKVFLSMNKEKLSIYLGLNRPSLSRELIRMKKDGLIDYDRYSITYLLSTSV